MCCNMVQVLFASLPNMDIKVEDGVEWCLAGQADLVMNHSGCQSVIDAICPVSHVINYSFNYLT